MVDPTDLAKVAASLPPAVLEQVYKDLLQPGAQQAGKAIGSILGLANTALVPIEWLNERRRIWLAHHLESYRQKMEHVSEDDVIPVCPEVGVPILERLSYYTDETLSELFINLLVTASEEKTVDLAHPGFIRVIENLYPDEAKLLLLFRKSDYVTYIDLDELKQDFPKVSELGRCYFGATSGLTLKYPQNIKVYEANLEGLGILVSFIPEEPQEVFDKMRVLVHELGIDVDHPDLPPCWKCMLITPYGRMFLDACTKGMAQGVGSSSSPVGY